MDIAAVKTPAGDLRVAVLPADPYPGFELKVGDETLAMVEWCSTHGAMAVHVYHPRQEEPVASVHLYADAASVEVALDENMAADGSVRIRREDGLHCELGRRLEFVGLG